MAPGWFSRSSGLLVKRTRKNYRKIGDLTGGDDRLTAEASQVSTTLFNAVFTTSPVQDRRIHGLARRLSITLGALGRNWDDGGADQTGVVPYADGMRGHRRPAASTAPTSAGHWASCGLKPLSPVGLAGGGYAKCLLSDAATRRRLKPAQELVLRRQPVMLGGRDCAFARPPD